MKAVDRRRVAAGLGLGIAAPGLVARAGEPAVPAPTPASPSETIETSRDPYRRMTAPVWLDDKGPYDFVVDTGANQTVVARELAAELMLPPGPPELLNGAVDAEVTPSALAERIRVGSRVDRNVIMPTLPEADVGADGILGLDRVKNQRVTLDFRAHQLTIDRSHGGRLPPYTVRVPAQRRFGQLMIVDAELASVRIKAFLDSGAERTIGNPALLELAIPRNPRSRFLNEPLISVTGKTTPSTVALLPILRLGQVRLANIFVTFADLHVFRIWNLRAPALLVGMDVLSVFDSVTLEFARSEVWFELRPRP